MRNLIPITTEFIRSSRSIDILHFVEEDLIQTLQIYNYEGLHFHNIDTLIRLIKFFEERLEKIDRFIVSKIWMIFWKN